MTAPPGRRSQERARGRRHSVAGRTLAWILRLAVLAAVFLAGLSIGRAVEDAPRPGGTQTGVRTLEPLTVQPEERTVTVTTESP